MEESLTFSATEMCDVTMKMQIFLQENSFAVHCPTVNSAFFEFSFAFIQKKFEVFCLFWLHAKWIKICHVKTGRESNYNISILLTVRRLLFYIPYSYFTITIRRSIGDRPVKPYVSKMLPLLLWVETLHKNLQHVHKAVANTWNVQQTPANLSFENK